MRILLTFIAVTFAFSATTQAEPLTLSYSDPVEDQLSFLPIRQLNPPPSAGVADLVSLVFYFDSATGEYEIILAASQENPFVDLVRFNILLFNPDTGTTAQDPAFFRSQLDDIFFDAPTTTVRLTGFDSKLFAWRAGDRVAPCHGLSFGELGPCLGSLGLPDGITGFGTGSINLTSSLSAVGTDQFRTAPPATITEVAADGPTWTPTGSMPAERRDHKAILLPSGEVLILGGTRSGSLLYDPAVGGFTALGRPNCAHVQGVVASPLADGRVLVLSSGANPRCAETYDPTTDAFTRTGTPNVAHDNGSATLLADGTVLVAGGQFAFPDARVTHDLAEIYDPVAGTFTLTGSLTEDRLGHTATLLPNGRVLITGGIQTTTPGFAIRLSSAELYDPTTGTFSLTGNMDHARNEHTATLLPNGQVLVTGVLFITSAELYDPALGTFGAAGNMTSERSSHTATLLPNGRVLIAGGVALPPSGVVTLNSAELYDPLTSTFSATASMNAARQQHTATLLADGQVLVAGGFSRAAGTNLSSAELFAVFGTGTLTVDIDIKPGSDPNSIDPRSEGKIPVAVLTTDDFDPWDVDSSTLAFGPAGAGTAHSMDHAEDVDGDGDIDMVVHFNTQETGIACGDTEATLTGETFDGTAIEGTDSVKTAGCK